MMLVKNPALFDVLVMPKALIFMAQHQAAILAREALLWPRLYCVHGSTPDIAGKNLANPTALLLSSVTMLRHLEMHDKADCIQDAILNTIAQGKYRTADLGGSSSTTDFTKAIIDHL